MRRGKAAHMWCCVWWPFCWHHCASTESAEYPLPYFFLDDNPLSPVMATFSSWWISSSVCVICDGRLGWSLQNRLCTVWGGDVCAWIWHSDSYLSSSCKTDLCVVRRGQFTIRVALACILKSGEKYRNCPFETESQQNFCYGLTEKSLRAGLSGDQITVGARFSGPVPTGPGAHPASYTMGTGTSPWVKRPGRGVVHPPHLVPRLKKD